MKQLLLFLLLLPLSTFAQNPFGVNVDSVTGLVYYSKVIELPGISKDSAFLKAKDWIVSYYNSPKDVLNYSDKETGIILIKAHYDQKDSSDKERYVQRFYYDLKLQFKNDKYRYTFMKVQRSFSFLNFNDPSGVEATLLFDSTIVANRPYLAYRRDFEGKLSKTLVAIVASLTAYLNTKQDF